MTMLFYVQQHVIPAAFTLLPERMRSRDAERMLLAIALQESGFRHRRQINGPARGWWQFEMKGGVLGVLTHRASREHALAALNALGYPQASMKEVYVAIEHNDVLAAVFARLLLWTLPHTLPDGHDYERAWEQYLASWRPGKPHVAHWRGHYGIANDMVST